MIWRGDAESKHEGWGWRWAHERDIIHQLLHLLPLLWSSLRCIRAMGSGWVIKTLTHTHTLQFQNILCFYRYCDMNFTINTRNCNTGVAKIHEDISFSCLFAVLCWRTLYCKILLIRYSVVLYGPILGLILQQKSTAKMTAIYSDQLFIEQ